MNAVWISVLVSLTKKQRRLISVTYLCIICVNMAPPRRKCHFNLELQKEYPFMKIKNKLSPHIVYCEICRSDVDISNSGRSNIKAHLTKKKHTLAANTKSKSAKLNTFFKNENFSSENMLIAAKEGTFAYHTIKHQQSFRSLDCTSKLIANMFEPKFMAARTKTEAIVKNVFAKESQLRLELDLHKAHFVSIMIDSSNHKEIKMVPLLVRYFNCEKGIQVKLLQLQDLPGETSEQLNGYVFNTLKTHNLVDKCIGLAADNTNTNFGGMKRKGVNNLFKKLNASRGKPLVGIGCVAHILNNCVQNATDVLPIDVEVIVVKLFKHFYIYTVRVNELKQFCDFVNVEYKKMLSFSKTRFLSLMPAIERILQMYEPLKAYFLSIENCPMILKQFFECRTSEIWMWFVHNIASMFHKVILKVEGDKICATEAALEYFDLKNKLENRLNELFLPLKVRESLLQLDNWEGSLNYRDDFISHVRLFYSNCVSYLKNWSTNLNELRLFGWINLRNQVSWNQILCSCAAFKDYLGSTLNEDELFDEVSLLQAKLSEDKIAEWNSKNIATEDRWVEVFKWNQGSGSSEDFKNCKILCQFIICLPGTSASIERLFSKINNYWSAEKSQMKISTLEAVMQVYTNFDETCSEMFQFLKTRKQILESILSSQKYDWHKGDPTDGVAGTSK